MGEQVQQLCWKSQVCAVGETWSWEMTGMGVHITHGLSSAYPVV